MTNDTAGVRQRAKPGPPVELMGVDFDPFTSESLVDYLVQAAKVHEGGVVVTPNVDALRRISRSPVLKDCVRSAAVCVADGMPLVWASRLQGSPLPERVAGSDLTVNLTKALAGAGLSIFLLGGNPGTADAAANALRRLAPGLVVIGTYCPKFGFDKDPSEVHAAVTAAVAAKAKFVYIALPFDKAVSLSTLICETCPALWCLGIGVSLSFVAGEISRAPRWMQRAGLEWLHRLTQEPGRLSGRYLFSGPPVLARLVIGAGLRRLQQSHVLSDRAGRRS